MFDTTKHAAAVIAARGIKQEWVDFVLASPVLTHPDSADADLEHRLAVIHEYGGRVLRVIVKRDTVPTMVITAYFDRTMKGKL
jgi:hypothetical protein